MLPEADWATFSQVKQTVNFLQGGYAIDDDRLPAGPLLGSSRVQVQFFTTALVVRWRLLHSRTSRTSQPYSVRGRKS